MPSAAMNSGRADGGRGHGRRGVRAQAERLGHFDVAHIVDARKLTVWLPSVKVRAEK